MRSWGVLAVVCGCGRVAFDPYAEGAADAAVADACVPGPFGPAVNLGSLINTAGEEWAPAVSGDGLELYFSSVRSGGAGSFDIWRASRSAVGQPWGTVVNVSEINTAMVEISPAISADGLTMYFARDLANRELFMATRAARSLPFETPVQLEELSTASVEDAPSPLADGRSLLFRSTRAGGMGGSDIYLATRDAPGSPFGTTVNVAALNSSADDRGSAISFDGLTVVFGSTRGGTGYDLYMASRATTAEGFGPPTPLTALNTTSADDDAAWSPDTLELYFVSDRPGGQGTQDIYVSTRSCL